MAAAAAQQRIAFQGLHGAYSDLACREVFPKMETLACHTFEDAFASVRDGRARYGMIPIDNSLAGRVADIHRLLPLSGVHIIGEHFLRVRHNLLAIPGARLDTIRRVKSHTHALGQCREFIRLHGFEPVVHADTAGAAAEIAGSGDTSVAAIASKLAADIYGLSILASDIEDADHNTTRFLIVAQEPIDPNPEQPTITSFVFRVRSVPAALYKSIGGFSTNGINIVKIESYIIDERFTVAQFYVEVEGHPRERRMQLAFEELEFFSQEIKVLGVYPVHSFRLHGNGK
jgi:prephenate dehydratase